MEREKSVSDMSSADRPSGANASQKQVGGAVDETTLGVQAKRAVDFVRMLVGKMAMDAEVSVAPDDGEGGDDEGQHGQREEAHPGREGREAEVVLNIERQVQEHGEDRG